MSRRANKNRQVRPQVSKPRKHETLEDRVVMSADPIMGPMVGLHESPVVEVPVVIPHDYGSELQLPVMDMPAGEPDFWIDPQVSAELALDELDRMVDTMLREGHALTGQDDVVNRYGFTGAGQTVAVIDTGIAYNHYALGGGTGSGYRVVGGWDFAEGDADFNDDSGNSKAGHGTHVAGIVGASSDSPHNGVATGVDLVGLRVFDDSGAGYFSWIEQALQWVHTNRDAYDSPITTVNLSLGTTWNSDDNPGWAMLENEFAQLEADGIFISVSAGNSYEDFNANGVSYPASSDYVIPVMATKDDGSLAYFSQRATYAIGAPGWAITSTVPDHNGNDADSIDDDWGVKYGTSMAAPYLAGASTLVREAMEFVGQTGIDQWDIYDHIMDTADSFYDSTSSTNYKRLNLEAAIDALMPVDDHGTSVATASNLGTLGEGTSSTSGVISTLDDGDYFTFTAGVSGVVTVSAINTTHNLTASWDAWGGEWTDHENGCQIDVVAGQTYSVALSTSNGLGHYDLRVEVESTFSAVDWGAIGTQETRSWQPTSSEQWFSVTVGRTGYFTAEALPNSGSASVAIYDAQQNLLAAAGTRADFQATAGQTLLLRVTGDAPEYNVRMTNAVTVSGGVATLVGTAGDDAIDFVAGESNHSLSLNGVAYTVSADSVHSIAVEESDGSDRLHLTGTANAESIELSRELTTFQGEGLSFTAEGIADVVVYGGGGADTAVLNDTAGNELLRAYAERIVFTGSGFSHRLYDFASTVTHSTGGNDSARMYDSAGDDAYLAYSNRVVMSGTGYSNEARGFKETYAYASGGTDEATFYDSAGNDLYRAYGDRVILSGAGFLNWAGSFESTKAYSTGGQDVARMHDTAEDDLYSAYSDRVVMSGAGFSNQASGFRKTFAYSDGGSDEAFVYDSSGDDLYRAYWNRVIASGTGYFNWATGFASTYAYASEGSDLVRMYDSAGDDLYRTYEDRVIMSGAGYFNWATGFDETYGYASSGNDAARMYDSARDDLYRAYSDRVTFSGDGFFNWAGGFESTYGYSTGGSDTVRLHGTAGDELFRSYDDRATMEGTGFMNWVSGFDLAIGYSEGGNDSARFYDSTLDDALAASGSRVTLTYGEGQSKQARGFTNVDAESLSGGVDTVAVGATDFALSLTGSWI